MRSRGTRTRNVSRSGQSRYLDWQPRCLVSKTGSFTSRPHDRFAFFSLRRCGFSSVESFWCWFSPNVATPAATVYVSQDGDSRAGVSVAARIAVCAIGGASTTPREFRVDPRGITLSAHSTMLARAVRVPARDARIISRRRSATSPCVAHARAVGTECAVLLARISHRRVDLAPRL